MKFQPVILLFSFFFVVSVAAADPRNIANGNPIPDELYSDQPYIVEADDRAWVCVMTTGAGHEGIQGQHLVAQRSIDKGKTWTDRTDIEPADGPEASYAVLLKAPSGRIFVFYDYNSDNRRTIIGDDPPYKDGVVKRVDCQGDFVFKYSDDHGKTWSPKRYVIPVRAFEIDRKNPYKGEVRYFWNVGKAFTHNGGAYVPLCKVGAVGIGFYTIDEGVLLNSPDLFTQKDPAKAKWITLPDGEHGIKTPEGGGPIAEEHSYVVLSDGSFYVTFRTIDGFPANSYSRDGGRTWEPTQYMRFADGRHVKHPRAANFVWKCQNGKYLYWFHNHGGDFIGKHSNNRGISYLDRNPVWISGGVEADSPAGKIIRWSEPEILLYDDDPLIRISYPDLLEYDGQYYISETQKDHARTHHIDKSLFEGLWGQFDNAARTTSGLVAQWQNRGETMPHKIDNPKLPLLYVTDNKAVDRPGKPTRKGFTVEIGFTARSLRTGQVLIDTRQPQGSGYCIRVGENQTVEIVMNDGQNQATWSCDRGVIEVGKRHHISFIVDGGPHVVSVVADGRLNDGGSTRQFGWGRFSPYLQRVSGTSKMTIGASFDGTVESVAVYDRALRTSEAIGNYRSDKQREQPR